MRRSVTIGIIQAAPVYLDAEKSLEKALALIEEAVHRGAELVVFGETWFTGYPAWIDFYPDIARWNHGPVKKLYARMLQNCIRVPGKELNHLQKLAAKHQVVIVLGANETRDTGVGNGTIYNSLLIINGAGELANHHRKMVPTFNEKLLYGIGDAHGLKAVETGLGRIGGLICWEHWMPLARQAMHNSGEHIHVALWPTVHEVHQLASRHYAFEGRCFVVAVGQIIRIKDIPEELEPPPEIEDKPDHPVLTGGSCIIGPDAAYCLEPQFDREGIILHTLENMESIWEERITLDTSGHYNRLDLFDFQINNQRKK